MEKVKLFKTNKSIIKLNSELGKYILFMVIYLGLKHGKYIYVRRSDGWYVKVRILGIRFKKKSEENIDINDPNRYIVLPVKTREPPQKAVIVREENIPEVVRKTLWRI